MICQECNKRPATLHFTKIINGEKAETHVCEHCAQEKGEMFMLANNQGFSINNLIAGLLNMEPSLQEKQRNSFHQNEVIQCEKCKMTYTQFLNIGKFGCSECYKTFKNHLTPILKRFHSGNTIHSGKIPTRIGGNIHLRKQIEQYKQTLQEYIVSEEFEKAAEVRDKVRALERSLSQIDMGEG
ncbi:UvrB/UvrC motif-containing protein [Bacillus sp. SM2101]|uniref:UvrB/UvrC motif-containing protein n=1 Tax=Bacillus sp. SM2101 TaxID=2805366 RepID=UPI001BDE3749|nr:UvrB/UvrC motif-containing protein [Bacillus sp. SM2101]